MVRIDMRILEHQLELIDQAAKDECTSRSELIRTAINWYLKPQNRANDQGEEDYIFATIKHRRTRASYNKWLKEHGHEIDAYDG